jgi:metal-responsive CopG/Arc/MetJ family transcriptional regulator
MPQVYFSLPAEDLAAVDYLAERDFDGNRSGVLREAVTEYLAGRADMEGAR